MIPRECYGTMVQQTCGTAAVLLVPFTFGYQYPRAVALRFAPHLEHAKAAPNSTYLATSSPIRPQPCNAHEVCPVVHGSFVHNQGSLRSPSAWCFVEVVLLQDVRSSCLLPHQGVAHNSMLACLLKFKIEGFGVVWREPAAAHRHQHTHSATQRRQRGGSLGTISPISFGSRSDYLAWKKTDPPRRT